MILCVCFKKKKKTLFTIEYLRIIAEFDCTFLRRKDGYLSEFFRYVSDFLFFGIDVKHTMVASLRKTYIQCRKTWQIPLNNQWSQEKWTHLQDGEFVKTFLAPLSNRAFSKRKYLPPSHPPHVREVFPFRIDYFTKTTPANIRQTGSQKKFSPQEILTKQSTKCIYSSYQHLSVLWQQTACKLHQNLLLGENS